MIFNPEKFWRFAARVIIPSKERGLLRITEPLGTQTHLVDALAAGLEDGIHDFVVLKGGRQVGGTTTCELLDLYWPVVHSGTVGMVVFDDDDNLLYHRQLLREMCASVPRGLTVPLGMNNAVLMEFLKHRRTDGRVLGGSMLTFGAAGMKSGDKLGRSKGLSYLHADEPGFWLYEKGVSALRAALAETNPTRLYLWIGTANGIGTVFHDMVKTAKRAVTQRFVFLASWQHAGYRKTREHDRAVWDRYMVNPPTSEERDWIKAVKAEFGHAITPEYLCWWRWKLAEGMNGDETMMYQEFSPTPAYAFQAFGDKYISAATIHRMRQGLPKESPVGHVYEWGPTLDRTVIHREALERASLCVWAKPDPEGVYIVSAHPWGSSSPWATANVVQVWRAWPDALEQVAEFYAEDSLAGFHLAWVIAHLGGLYKHRSGTIYDIMEVNATGMPVFQELRRLESAGYGLSLDHATLDVLNLFGSISHYLHRRPDSIRPRTMLQWKSSSDNRIWLLSGLRDEAERGLLIPRSSDLVDELAGLRRGESGNNDLIAGGAQRSDARAIAVALAVRLYHEQVREDLRTLGVGARIPGPPISVGEWMVGGMLDSLLRGRE